VFYGGASYSPAEFDAAQKAGQYKVAPVVNVSEVAANTAPSISSLMAFDGPAPETINGRLAMLGFVAALGAELATGESVVGQLGDAPAPILLTFVGIAVASLLPMTSNVLPEEEAVSVFTADAERINGRAAMIGFAALLVVELFKGGKALF